jgi:cell division protein FtsA
VVVTGGTAQLPGIKEVAEHILGLPVRIGVPTSIEGLTDSIGYPAYATSVGLVFWGIHHGDPGQEHGDRAQQRWGDVYSRFKGWLREFFP